MERLNKKTIGGIALAAILITATFTVPTASADLTALDKIGTILNIISSIFTEVTNIEEKLDGTRPSLVTNINQTVSTINATVNSPVFGNEEIKNEVRNIEGNVTQILGNVTTIRTDIQDKKSFYFNKTMTTFMENGTRAAGFFLVCPTEVPSGHRAFNAESIFIEVGDVEPEAGESITIFALQADGIDTDITDITFTVNGKTNVLAETGISPYAATLGIFALLDTMQVDGIVVTATFVGELPQACRTDGNLD